ncbi:MAG: hemolysin III [Gammaproteobacteria bacterium]|jgi:hemolysin III
MYHGEKLNSITHLVGTALSLIGLGALLTVGVQSGDPWVLVSFSVFGFTMVLLYTMSTLYHSFEPTKLKKLFKLFDHVSIYLLIAGTYTPYTLVGLRDTNGWTILIVIWILAAIGILSEIYLSGRAVKVGQMIIYLLMGWACTFDFASFEAAIPSTGMEWLKYGGIAYSFGVIFYIIDKTNRLPHAHGIWHFFVLVGTACHFVSIIGYVR